jgi:malate dehydrogenase (oxaloacetate-decarboxylating)(NADP+)
MLDGKTFLPGQANNFYIFPAIGLAVYATQAKRVPDELFIAAAQASANQVGPKELEDGMLFPPQGQVQQVEVATAMRVAEKIFDLGLARVPRPKDIPSWINSLLYKAEYPE